MGLALCVYVFGAGLRFWHHFTRGALWIDEAGLAMNITSTTLSEAGTPFLYYQACGYGFLLIGKLFVALMGNSERVLRSLPLLCGLATPWLAYLIARRTLSKTTAWLTFLLCSINPALVYYSAEFKPYGTDAFVATLLILLAARALEKPRSPGAQIALAIYGATAPWLSLPAIFVMGGVGGTLLLADLLRRHPFKRILFTGLMLVGWVLSFVLHYLMFMAHSATAYSKHIKAFWNPGFAPFPPTSLADLKWYAGKYFFAFFDPGGFNPRYFGGLLFALGALLLLRKGALRALFLLSTFGLLYVASALQKYPAVGRLLVFVAPLILMLCALGATAVLTTPKRWLRLTGAVLLGLSFISTGTLCFQRLGQTIHSQPDLKDSIAFILENHRPQDVIFVEDSLEWSFDYYAHRAGLKNVAVFRMTQRDQRLPLRAGDDRHPQISELKVSLGRPRVWVLTPNSSPHVGESLTSDAFFKQYLERKGRPIQQLKTVDSTAFLYDLSGAQR